MELIPAVTDLSASLWQLWEVAGASVLRLMHNPGTQGTPETGYIVEKCVHSRDYRYLQLHMGDERETRLLLIRIQEEVQS